MNNVNILIKGKNIGTTSDELGKFSIKSDKLPTLLEISHIGFEAKTIILEFAPLDEIEIFLKPKIATLKGVLITTEKIDTVYHDRDYSVKDYKLVEEGILILIFRNTLNKSELVLTDYDGNKINTLQTLPGKPVMLYKDCLGNIHFFTKTKSFQIYIESGDIILYPGVDLDWFVNTMKYCRFLIGSKMYYQQSEYLDLVVNYYYVDTNSISRKIFHTVKDQDKIDFLYYNPENFSLLLGRPGPDLGELKGLATDKAILDQIRFIEIEKRFNSMAYLSPAFAPMHVIGDSVCVFNFPDSKLEFFNDKDSLFSETNISFHKQYNNGQAGNVIESVWRINKWQPEIYIDRKKRKAYSLFLNNSGTKELKEINLETGETEFKIKIPFPYVSTINVHNGYAYFIYKGWGESQNKKLFRQRIE
ncbi:MAG: hypothetical protein R2764_12655 [Bacteroidales bacterium]